MSKKKPPFEPTPRGQELLDLISKYGAPTVRRRKARRTWDLPRGITALEDHGFTRRTVYNLLPGLERAGLVRVTRHGIVGRLRPVSLEVSDG